MTPLSCYCESSRCDHEGRCERPASGHVRMDYVGQCCDTCAANMAADGGACHIHLRDDVAEWTMEETAEWYRNRCVELERQIAALQEARHDPVV